MAGGLVVRGQVRAHRGRAVALPLAPRLVSLSHLASRIKRTAGTSRLELARPLFKVYPCHGLQPVGASRSRASRSLGESLLPFCSPIRNAYDRKGQVGHLARDGLRRTRTDWGGLNSIQSLGKPRWPRGRQFHGHGSGTPRDASADGPECHMVGSRGCCPEQDNRSAGAKVRQEQSPMGGSPTQF